VIRAKIRKIPETAISLWDFCSEKTRYFGGKRVNLRIQKSFRHMHSTKFKTRKRFRLTFVNENTFNAVWTLRLSQAKVWALTVLVVAAIAALVACILVATPISKLLPGYLDAAQRRDHVVNTMRVDSLATEAAEHRAYIDNIIKILEGTDADSAAVVAATAADEAKVVTDTLMPASERERKYVAQWNDRERYNLSVLTPIAAEGMTFSAPTAMARPDTLLEPNSCGSTPLAMPPSSPSIPARWWTPTWQPTARAKWLWCNMPTTFCRAMAASHRSLWLPATSFVPVKPWA
jgi:hypothetical protein